MKLELRGITKRFGDFTANDAIDLVIEPGTVHALFGENGAGKSTLMNVLFGLYDPDGGEILIDDKPVSFVGPGDAMAAGIAMVHQELAFCPNLSVGENLCLGDIPRRAGFIDRSAIRKTARAMLDEIETPRHIRARFTVGY